MQTKSILLRKKNPKLGHKQTDDCVSFPCNTGMFSNRPMEELAHSLL